MGEKLGQHFLINPEVARGTAGLLSLSSNDKVLEIGPGKGFLTEYLIDSKAKITAVEIDASMISELESKFNNNSIEIINMDFLQFDLDNSGFNKVCGNVPYYIAGKILEKLLVSHLDWEIAAFMLPRPVAKRVAANVGDSDYSAISVITEATAIASMEIKADRDNFSPVPKVDSDVIRLIRTANPPGEAFCKTVRAAFSTKRKMLKNTFSRCFNIDESEILEIMKRNEIPSSARPQELDSGAYKRLAEEFVNMGIF